MNRDRQMAKDAENKQAQARENYAKNKQRLSEYKVKEKSTDYIHSNESDSLDEGIKEGVKNEDFD